MIRVLILGDEVDFLTAVAEGMDVGEVETDLALYAEQAMAMLAAALTDILVLDLDTPGEEGIEILERVKKTFPHVPVIILTGRGSDEEEVTARRKGAFNYLRKPLDILDLVESVRIAGKTGTGRS